MFSGLCSLSILDNQNYKIDDEKILHLFSSRNNCVDDNLICITKGAL